MPRYFFNIVRPKRVILDSTGKLLAGPEAAHWYAIRLTCQLRDLGIQDEGDWVLRITDESNRTLEVFVPAFLNLARGETQNVA